MVVSQLSDACCAITPSQPGKRCRIQEGGNDARLSGEHGMDRRIHHQRSARADGNGEGLAIRLRSGRQGMCRNVVVDDPQAEA